MTDADRTSGLAADGEAGARPSGLPQFFRHHGLMSPGIRLFRVIGFPAKAAWVSAAFLVPLALLGAALWTAASSNIDFSAKERLGTDYARNVIALIDVAQGRRRAAMANAADLPATSERVQHAFDTVRDFGRRFDLQFGSGQGAARVAQLQQRLADAPVAATPTATFAAHTAFIAGALELLSDVADGSNLTLDPDLDSFYMMDAAIFQQPNLIETMGQLRGLGNAILLAGEMSPDQRDTLIRAVAFARLYQANLSKSLNRATAANPELARLVDPAEATAANETFVKMAQERLLVGAVSGPAAGFLAQANHAVELNYRLNGRLMTALEGVLDARVAKLRQALWEQIAVGVYGVLLAMYLLLAFYRVTQGGISEVARHLNEISAGNLTERPRPWGHDEAAMLMHTLARTLESLRRVVNGVRESAREMDVASTEIASASMDLSRRTEDTAARLQRSSSALEEMDTNLRQTAETAQGASVIVDANAEVASRGGHAVAAVVDTMQGIHDSLGRIAEIIGVIDGIAFQTNILALNAAVEAARAGEQGRGFAVVATEVRALSQRTTTAAREVKALIQSSVERVVSGSSVVARAGDTMGEVVGNASRIKSLITEISSAAAQQSGGLSEVARSMEQLDVTTQQNAALVEQTAAAAAALKQSAARLSQEVAYFRIS